jgi:hypothetical protein
MQVLAIAIWINNHNLVVNVTSQELTLAASLKVSNCVLGLSPFMWKLPVATVHIILAKNNIISLPLPFMYARFRVPSHN